ncbi:MAG: 50S ribosomal protein L4 [Candidatus Pacebacteria bacterium]|nr:50S ribosomal protein L4 [Candidatus Paceibacterota bacterium]
MEAKIYNTKGKEAGKIALNENVWGLSWNGDLVHQVVESMRSNARVATASVKDRGEVSGGGKRPWQQKGTGQARHSTIRSPLWRHGGITHGPLTDANYSKKINKKIRSKALYTVLSEKLRNNEILFVDAIAMDKPKTSEIKGILASLGGIKGFEKLSTRRKNTAYITTAEKNPVVSKSFANFSNVHFDDLKNMDVLSLLNYKFVVIVGADASVKWLEGKLAQAKVEVVKEAPVAKSKKATKVEKAPKALAK